MEESKQLLVQADKHRLHALWVLLVMLGVRRGEALTVRWADVDLDAGTVAVLGSLQRVGSTLQRVPTKTRGSLRTIPLPAPCVPSSPSASGTAEFRSVGGGCAVGNN